MKMEMLVLWVYGGGERTACWGMGDALVAGLRYIGFPVESPILQ